MKNTISKLLVVATMAIGSASAMAGDLNAVCAILNYVLPGDAVMTTGFIEERGYDRSEEVVISKGSKKGTLLFKTKEGVASAWLENLGSGESVNCGLIFNDDGIRGELIEMDADNGLFTFTEPARDIKLVIKKK